MSHELDRIRRSVIDMECVYEYATGNRRLPTTDITLGEDYHREIEAYFRSTITLLTTPGIVREIQKYNIGRPDRPDNSKPGASATKIDGLHLIAHINPYSSAILDTTQKQARLVFTTEEYMGNSKDVTLARQTITKRKLGDLEFIDTFTHDDYGNVLIARRPLILEDITKPDHLKNYVDGIGSTFHSMKTRILLTETAALDEKEIRQIAEAFCSANKTIASILKG